MHASSRIAAIFFTKSDEYTVLSFLVVSETKTDFSNFKSLYINLKKTHRQI